jgi:four helix bundle protein
MTFKTFEEIDAWKKARELTLSVYGATAKGTFARDHALSDQIRRACVSIMSNVAEGHGRGGTREFQQFLSMAIGSANEVSSQLYVALDQGYIDDHQFGQLNGLAQDCASLIGGLSRYLRTTEIKGRKFKSVNSELELRTKNSKPRTSSCEPETKN